MRDPIPRHLRDPLLVLGFLLASSPLARAGDAGDAGDASPYEGGGGDATDAGSRDGGEDAPADGSLDSPLEAVDIDAGVGAAESSAPAAGTAECPVANIGNPCDGGGTCIPATCADWGSPTMRACAACSYSAVPYCATPGPACEDGEVCEVMGGSGGSGVSLDGGSEFVSYANMGCGPPPGQSPPAYTGRPDGDTSTSAPPACSVVAPLGTAPGRFAALAGALAVLVAGRRRRSARKRRPA